jgi:hypothetical protein
MIHISIYLFIYRGAFILKKSLLKSAKKAIICRDAHRRWEALLLTLFKI